ncbi:MAG: hypothetical protein ACTSYH_00375 [Candidatus Heimdallarchaeaceae archaeon]
MYCGETGKSKYPPCRYCGEVIRKERLPEKEPEKEPESPKVDYDYE